MLQGSLYPKLSDSSNLPRNVDPAELLGGESLSNLTIPHDGYVSQLEMWLCNADVMLLAVRWT
jgi:hypothetical protein